MNLFGLRCVSLRVHIAAAILLCVGSSLTASPTAPDDQILSQLNTGDPAGVASAVLGVRNTLRSNPREAVEKLNSGWMEALLKAERYDEVEEFANAGSIAVARDTWPV